jgi:hypothetical protein
MMFQAGNLEDIRNIEKVGQGVALCNGNTLTDVEICTQQVKKLSVCLSLCYKEQARLSLTFMNQVTWSKQT